MASLKDATAVTEQLEDLAGRLHAEVTEGRADFAQLADLADQIGESADAVAAVFMAIDEALERRLAESRGEVTREKTQKRRGQGARSRGAKASASSGREKGSGSGTAAKTSDDASSAPDEPSREDLLERAKELEIAGRSTMSKEELVAAIQAEEQVSKDELLERAREAGVAGRSTMSKEELADAVRSEESLSREELLERAREADIPGRSEMSKEELREALRPQ